MPRFEVDCKRSLSLTATLVDVSCCVIEDFKHRNKAVAVTICTSDVTITCSNSVNGKTNTTGKLAYYRALFQRIVNSVYRILSHSQKEARTHLGLRCSGVEQSWRCVGKPLLTH